MSTEETNITIKELIATPEGKYRRFLWLGLALFLITFSCKQLLVSYSLTRLNNTTEVLRLEFTERAEVNDLTNNQFELEIEINELNSQRQKPFGNPKKSSDPNTTTEYYEKQEKLDELRDELQKELRNIAKENKKKTESIRQEYSRKISKLKRDMPASSASAISLIQNSLWLKLLLDIGKIIGCVFVIFSSFKMVCDENETAAVKTFATVTAGTTLVAILVMGALSMLG